MKTFSAPRFAVALVLFALSHVASAGVLLDLDAAAIAKLPGTAAVRVEDVPFRTYRECAVFDGSQRLDSGVVLPAGFEKGHAFTVEAWVRNPSLDRAETVISFAMTNGAPGTEFNFSGSPSAGAFRSGFKATTPFNAVPWDGEWHHLAWTWTGGTDSVLRVFVDGELDLEKTLRFTFAPQPHIFIGASGGTENKKPRSGFSGSIARVRVQDEALSQDALRKGANMRAAIITSPKPRAVTDSLSVTLKWQRGTDEAASYVLYFGTNFPAVSHGDPSFATPTTETEAGPMRLKAGVTYAWRVEQLDKDGRIIPPSRTLSFTADPGLATEPQPRDNNSNVPATHSKLAWKAGKYATKQRVFFGTSADALQPAGEVAASAGECAAPLAMAAGTRYFWRVDSDNGDQPPSRGPLWTFRTQDEHVTNDITFFVGSDCHYGRENNAAINRRVIDEMNALPGTPLPANVGGGFVRTPRGVVLNGDLLDEGFNKDTAPALWAEFCRDYGLTGDDGRLCFPAYEGFGNHDGGPSKSFVRAGIKERNQRRIGLRARSENGLHYSWDWDNLHLVQLNLFGGDGPGDVKGVNGPEHDPEGSLKFLKYDLAQNVDTGGRPVIASQHFGWLGGMSDWWTAEAKERYFEAVKSYNIACLINGHSHGTDMIVWHDILTIHDGSTARGDGDSGDFLVVRVTEKELIVIQRKLGEWGVWRKKALTPQSEFVKRN